MDTLQEVIQHYIGVPPAGFEWVEYVLLCVVFLMFIKTVLIFFSWTLKMARGTW